MTDHDRIQALEQRVDAERMRADGIEQDFRIEAKNRLRAERALAAVQAEMAKIREEGPDAAEVKAVCDHWRKAMGKSSRTKTPLSGVRAKAVQARLKDRFTADELKRAVDGYARFPFVVNAQRVAQGQADERFDDLELICRNEKTVDKGLQLAARGGAVPAGSDGLVPAAQLAAAQREVARLNAVADSLARQVNELCWLEEAVHRDAYRDRLVEEILGRERAVLAALEQGPQTTLELAA